MANYVRSDVAIPGGLTWDAVDRYSAVSSPAPVAGAAGKILLSNTDGTFTLVEGANFAFSGAQFIPTAGTVTSITRITAATFTPSAGQTLETISGLSFGLIALSSLLTQANGTFPAPLLAGGDTLTGGAGADILSGFGGADVLDGGAGADQMNGGAGNDTYAVDNFGDRVIEDAGGGLDTVRVGAGLSAYSLGANVENVEFLSAIGVFGFGNALDNTMRGNAGADTLVGNEGNDRLDGQGGADVMIGGTGNDTYHVDSAGDVLTELAGEGTDTVIASTAAVTLSSDIENLLYDNGGAADEAFTGTGNASANAISGGDAGDTLSGLAGHDTLNGGGGGDTLLGGAGNDDLDGGSGADDLDGGADDDILRGILAGGADDNAADTLTGGGGNDTFLVGAGDTVSELFGGGNDLLRSTIALWDLAVQANVEDLIYDNGAATDAGFTGKGNALSNSVTGGDADDTLSGRDGNDTLSGGIGNDALIGDDDADGRDDLRGGAGGDTYYISHAGDLVTEGADTGFDFVFLTDNTSTSLGAGLRALSGLSPSQSYSMRDNVEALIYGSKPGAAYVGGALAFSLFGNASANVIIGGVQGDTIDGAGGDDVLAGGAGNDTYIVNSSSDRVYEGSFIRNGQLWTIAAAGGIDEVRSTANVYSLASSDDGYAGPTLQNEIENLVFIGTGNFAGYGNGFANQITGGLGNDFLDGRGGSDLLTGRGGNDTYVITSADTLVEQSGGGTDTILVSEAGFSLNDPQFANVENMTYDNGNIVLFVGDNDPLNDDGFFVGHGNGLNNVLRGGYNTDSLFGEGGNDFLDGRGGADNLVGGAGNDTYVLNEARDRVTEGAGGGADLIITSLGAYRLSTYLEHLTHTGSSAFTGYGNAGANMLTGGSGRDTLFGLNGIDALSGNAGNDVLAGGFGSDVLRGGAGSDIFLFNTALSAQTNIDRIIDFSSADTIKLENSAIFTQLKAGTLSAANFRVGTAAGDANDYIVYNRATGALFYDANGSGAGGAVQFATVVNKAALTHFDFIVI